MTTTILTVPLGDRSYDIFFGRDVAPMFQEWVRRFFPGGSLFLVTDKTVGTLYAEEARRWLAGIPHTVLEIVPGEESKNWRTVEEIYAFLGGGGADRDSLVVAFGGGVVGDLAGFAAATWLRGVAYLQVPTTLLSQVDSSVGGKTGFNLPEGKNLVGAFHQPRAVFIDQTFLKTLDERNLRSGMAEVVKCALAGNAALFDELEARGAGWTSMTSDEWQALISRTVAYKAAIVARDEKESSTRRVLNLGHTIGHGLEQAGGYSRLLHGEAVAMGLAWEAVFAGRQKLCPPELGERVVDVLGAMGYALDEPDLPLSSIAAAIGMDKKRVAADIDLPVVTAPGRCALRRVPVSLLRKELPAIRSELRERALRQGRSPDVASGARERIARGEAEDVATSLVRRVSRNPRDVEALVVLAEADRRLGKVAAAWETIKEALDQDPSNETAQRLAREIEGELRGAGQAGPGDGASPLEKILLLDDAVIPLGPAEAPAPGPADREEERAAAPPAGQSPVRAEESKTPRAPEPAAPKAAAAPLTVTTVTMADLYWRQGDRETARRIVDEILAADPSNARARAWLAGRAPGPGAPSGPGGGKGPERALLEFLESIAKEYGYDLSRPH